LIVAAVIGAVIGVMVCEVGAGVVSGLKGKLDGLTGGVHSRLVWTASFNTKLMGYDSEADEARQICTGEKILRPVITDGGHRVVFSDALKTYVINWDGSGKKLVSEYPMSDAWTDPSTGKVYAYVQTAWGAKTFGDCYKIDCDDPTDKTLLLHSRFGNGDMSWYQVSSDGRLAVDYLPWGGGSSGGGYVIKDGGLKLSTERQLFGGGCWSTVEKSTDYILINMQCCPHAGGDVRRFSYNERGNAMQENIGHFEFPGTVPEGTKEREWMLPKFASKGKRVICCIGGLGGTPKDMQIDCYIQRFSESYTAFDDWFRFTEGDNPNEWPDSWIGVEEPGPAIGIPVRELTFVKEQNGGNPAAQTVALTGTTGPLQNVTVESDVSWLQVSCDGSQITNTVDASGLAARIHMGRVTIRASNASPRENTYLVFLKVMGPPVPDFINISPYYGIVDTMSSISFSAVVEDQYGTPLADQPSSFTWENEGWRVRSFDPATATLYTSESQGIKPIKCEVRIGSVKLSEKGYALVLRDYDDPGAPVTDEGIKINCGGPAVDDWESDEAFLVSGKEGSIMAIDGATQTAGAYEPAPAAVYETARRGDHSYSFPSVTNGIHTVRLHITDPTGGDRAMRFVCENGQTGVNNLDVVAVTGQTGRAYIEEIRVEVSDGNGLQLDCYKGIGDDVFVSGIEVKPGLPDYYMSVTSPAAGDTLAVEETVDIRWEAGSKIGGVVIEVSLDGGMNWLELVKGGDIVPGDPLWLSYPWTIPPSIEGVPALSTMALVKIYDYNNQDAMGMSGVFVIEPGSSAKPASRARVVRTTHIGVAGDVLHVRSAHEGVRTVRVYRLDGRMVLGTATGPDGRTAIPLERLGTGVLVVRLHEGDKTVTRRLMQTSR
jgi:hypothetical protein